MVLDTMHDREFYLAKAEKHKLLEDIIDGRTSLRDQLDAIIAEIDPSPNLCAQGFLFDRGMKNYFQMLAELSRGALEGIGSYANLDSKWALNTAAAMLTTMGAAIVVVLSLPISVPLAAVGILGGGLGAPVGVGKVVYGVRAKLVRRRRTQILKPIYEAVDVLDSSIDRCFVFRHFHTAPERFTRTYRSLPAEKCEVVDALLHSCLRAGGIPGMDEQQLDEYLAGLLETAE